MQETKVLHTTKNDRSCREVQLDTNLSSSMIMSPLFILAPPRSFTSIVCAMLGQHRLMYGFPGTQLFTTETLAERWNGNSDVAPRIWHGLLRVVAQLFFGEQTAASITQARG